MELSGCNVNREHTGSLAHADYLLTRQFPVDITRKRNHKLQIGHMLLAV